MPTIGPLIGSKPLSVVAGVGLRVGSGQNIARSLRSTGIQGYVLSVPATDDPFLYRRIEIEQKQSICVL